MIGKEISRKRRKKLKKNEKIFLILLIFLVIFIWCGSKLFFHNTSDTICITVDGKVFGTYSLKENQIISIGDTNVCEIKNGEVKMIEANCPDHLCMEQNAITQNGGTIVCLPNKIVIQGEASSTSSEDFPELDAIS